MTPRVAVGLAVLSALGVVYFLGQGGRTPDPTPAVPAAETNMGFIALDAEIVETGDDGRALYRVEADRIVQEPATGAVTAEGLTMRYVPPADPARGWVLTARAADLPGGTTAIELTGDVRVTGQPPGGRGELTIRTEALVYDTATTVVRTDLPVVFATGPQVLTGRGLTANLKAGTLEIDSEVHGRFAP